MVELVGRPSSISASPFPLPSPEVGESAVNSPVKRKVAAWLADLEQIELAPAQLRPHLERVLSMHDAERVAVLEFLAGAGGWRITRLAQAL